MPVAAQTAHTELADVRSAELRAEGTMPEEASLRQIAAALEARWVRALQGCLERFGDKHPGWSH